MKFILLFSLPLALLIFDSFIQSSAQINYRKGNNIENQRADTNLVSVNDPWSIRMANSVVYRHPDFYLGYGEKNSWDYEQGLMLYAFYKLYLKTNEERYLNFIKNNLSHYIEDDGRIRTYNFSKFRLDDIAPGRILIDMFKLTGKAKYKIAADTLRKQLKLQPRTKDGGFWHKEIYPHQMWLDGLYMAEPFYAEYAKMFNEPSDFNDIAHQFMLIYRHTLDPKTGLLYHGWDESKTQKWADPQTGDSPNFWARGMGWYEMALVDVLDFFPKSNPKRKDLINILQETSAALLKYKDENTGLWYQVLDKGGKEGNFLEASASCMFVYAFAKGSNRGYLNKKYYQIAGDSYKGIIKNFISVNDSGLVNILHTCSGAGLGGDPYRDGSYDYYINTPQRTNDFKAIGPFILASIELNK